ncbi:protein WHAT'S THIS FACTOR 1, chloroplastic-like [Salvia miltiorrhiza]|uniref:protein WHAT'S THIS FACTOR 1, chloroplastic-like n=1 Tax=Salvia miltiorrhiza TaxID=226208 RepID=UPI0025AC2ADA|nr:protein WHAT'S THIS FACTOR 1, chloroplastic-like [Salvia miltiorrhiza]
MAALPFAPPVSPLWQLDTPSSVSLGSHFLPKLGLSVRRKKRCIKNPVVATTCSASPHKIIRDPRLDKHVVKQNKLRFVQKLKTLLLSKPKHFMPIQVLYKCRAYLSLPTPRSVLAMIGRYPTIFELFSIPTPATPFHAAGPLSQLCVRLTPPAAALAKKESALKKSMAISLAAKLQKLLMLASPYHRLLLKKLVHLAPDLGLPVNFRSRLCNDYPEKFKVVETSYGRALELVSWDNSLAKALPWRDVDESLGLIVDRPLKFKHLRLRKGLNIKRWHHEYLIKFKEFPDVCPYTSNPEELVKESMRAEKRACGVVREVLGMTVEKRTLVDHLTHFRKEFGLSNKLRGMLVRHPELFYISLKGQRDSVFLVEGYSDKGRLLEKDDTMVIKDEMMKLVLQGKRLRREGRKELTSSNFDTQTLDNQVYDDEDDDEYYDGLDDLFQVEDDFSSDDDDDDDDESKGHQEEGEFWRAEGTPLLQNHNDCGSDPW